MKLRKLQLEDLEIRVSWMNDPRIYETMHFTPPITIEGTTNWFNANQGNASRADFVLEDRDGVICVMNGLTGRDEMINKVESYTMVNPNYKAKGLGTKSLFLKSIYGFDILKINKVWAYIDGDNIASIKMCEKIGYKVEGIMREEVYRDGKLIDRYYMGCLASDLKRDAFKYIVNSDSVTLLED